MKTVLVQSDIVWGDPEANMRKNDAVLERHQGVDLVIFPEMFSTGFVTEPEGIAEKEPSRTLEWMKKSAAKYGFAIAGSVSIKIDSSFLNRFYFVKPSGEVTVYDKHHLFTFGAEHDFYTPGEERKIVEWKGVRFLLAVCYDLRFPVWLRNRQDYDVIICVANWPSPRRMNWDVLLRARAIENQCYALGINRVGNDPTCEYDGGTAVIHYFGDTISSCTDSTECECEAELDMDILKAYWDTFPALKDADNFEIK
ncbi:MAG: amidohydrolase [Bacteroidales bacterium]|nr:amidohydrolase [Bacteroidales bacterium]